MRAESDAQLLPPPTEGFLKTWSAWFYDPFSAPVSKTPLTSQRSTVGSVEFILHCLTLLTF